MGKLGKRGRRKKKPSSKIKDVEFQRALETFQGSLFTPLESENLDVDLIQNKVNN